MGVPVAVGVALGVGVGEEEAVTAGVGVPLGKVLGVAVLEPVPLAVALLGMKGVTSALAEALGLGVKRVEAEGGRVGVASAVLSTLELPLPPAREAVELRETSGLAEGLRETLARAVLEGEREAPGEREGLEVPLGEPLVQLVALEQTELVGVASKGAEAEAGKDGWLLLEPLAQAVGVLPPARLGVGLPVSAVAGEEEARALRLTGAVPETVAVAPALFSDAVGAGEALGYAIVGVGCAGVNVGAPVGVAAALGLAALVTLPSSVLVVQRVAPPVADAQEEAEEAGERVALKVLAPVALPPSAPAGESEALVLTMAREVGEGRLLGVGPRQAVCVALAEALAAAEAEATCSAVLLVEVEAVGEGLTLPDPLASEDWLALACAVAEGSSVRALEAVATGVPAPLAEELALAVPSAEALAVPAALAVTAVDAVEAALERASELRVGLSVLLAAPVAREAGEDVSAAEKDCKGEAVEKADGRVEEVGALAVNAGAEMLALGEEAALLLAAAVSEGLADDEASVDVTAVGEGVGCAAVALAQFCVAVPTAPQLLLPAAVALPVPPVADTHALAKNEEEGGADWLCVALAVSLALVREENGDCEALALADTLAAEALEDCEAPRVAEVAAEAVAQALKDQTPEPRAERVAAPLA